MGEDLLGRLEAAGGRLAVDAPTSAERARLRRAISLVVRTGAVPDGMRLRHTGRDSGDMTIWLEPIPDPDTTEKPPTVPVPAMLRGAHTMVLAAREHRPARDGWVDTRSTPGALHLKVHKDSLNRALRIAQGLVNAAEVRGHQVAPHHSHGCDGGLGIVVEGHSVEVTVIEETRRIDHERTPAETGPYRWAPRWDFLPTGRLSVCLEHQRDQSTVATDRQRWAVEDSLGKAILRIEARGAAVAEREHERLVAEQRAEQRRLEAIEQARLEFTHRQRVDHARRQAEAHRIANELRQLVTDTATARLRPDQREWLDWIDQYATTLDPVPGNLDPPTLREPSARELDELMPPGLSSWRC